MAIQFTDVCYSTIRWWDWDNKTIDDIAELLMYLEKLFERFTSEKSS